MAAAPTRLRCDFLENPLGIDAERPQLSWLSSDLRPAERQTAWQVLAASEPGHLTEADADLWNSGRVPASSGVQVRYGGAALRSRQRVWWVVQSFDSDGLASGFSRPAYFEMGLLSPADWQGHWIGAAAMGSRTLPAPVPMLARDFELRGMPKKARLYVAAAGYCRGELNGQPLGIGLCSPTPSDYRQRLRYRVLDVTAFLTRGRNRLGLLLIDGTYAGNRVRGHQRAQFGERPLLMAQLEALAADGTACRIATDVDWHYRPSGWLASDPILGEHFDARQQPAYWSRPALDGTHAAPWQPVHRFPAPAGKLAADMTPAICAQARVLPQGPPTLVLDEWHQARWRYEFAEPVQGSIELQAALDAGQRLTIEYGSETAAPRREDSLTAASGLHRHQALSVVRRFTHITLAGDIDESRLPAVTAIAQRSIADLELRFDTDCKPLAQLHKELLRELHAGCAGQPLTGQGSEHGLPATTDLMAVLELLGRAREAAPMLRSWVLDLRDCEARRGDLSRVVPAIPAEPLLRETGGTEALALLAWSLYTQFGDFETVRTAYAAVRRLLFVMSELAPDHIHWAPCATSDPQLPADLAGTAWFYHSARLTAQMAGLLGKTADRQHFTTLATNIRAAFRRRFVTADGAVVSHTQSAYCLALYCELLDPGERAMAIAGLVTSLQNTGLNVQAGLLSELLRVLTRNGHFDLACQLIASPAGSAELAQRYGHSMVGAGALEWVYGELLGIGKPNAGTIANGAYRHIEIAPRFPLSPEDAQQLGLTRASGQCQSIRGAIALGWEWQAQGLAVNLRLPADTTAELQLPGRASEQLAAGEHERFVARSQLPIDRIPKLTETRQNLSLRYPRAS